MFLEVHWPSALALTASDRSVRLWDLCRGRCLQCLELGRTSVLRVDWQRHQLLAAGEDVILNQPKTRENEENMMKKGENMMKNEDNMRET